MIILETVFPYIGDQKIPLHYYSMLYPQLIRIWKNLVSFLKEEHVDFQAEKHNLRLNVSLGQAPSVLAMIHMSFMNVYGYYDGEKRDRREFMAKLWGKHIPSIIRGLEEMVSAIRRREYDEAYTHAKNVIKTIAEAEVDHAVTGGVINQTIFHMLHGQIPQTLTNTYLLAHYGSKQVQNIADKIYASVAEDAEKTIMVLKANRRMVERAGGRVEDFENTGIGNEEQEEDKPH